MDDPRLHICLSPDCNNNCIFCMEEDREARRRRLNLLDREQVEALLRSNKDMGKVLFTAGEPTLHPDLPLLIRMAAGLGYRSIGLITNGRRLAYAPYAEHLLSAGLNHAVVSIHGHTARIHDGLTRTPGSFEQTLAGLENLARLKPPSFRLHTSTVLNRRNLKHLEATLELLLKLPLNQAVLNAIQPLGRGASLFKKLVPTYSEMVEGVASALERFRSERGRIRLVDVPPCILLRLPEEVRGRVENHQHFEPEGGLPDELARELDEAALRVPVRKEDYDRVQRIFGPPCDPCPLRPSCDGVWTRYAAERGWDEFGVKDLHQDSEEERC